MASAKILGFMLTIQSLTLLKPARKHFDVVLKRLDLARIRSRRMAHLRHTFTALELVWFVDS